MAFTTRRRLPIVMRGRYRAPLVLNQDESWSYAWSLVLGVGWVLLAVGLVDVALEWLPVQTNDEAGEFGAVERCVSSLTPLALGLAFVGVAGVLTKRRRTVSLVATLGLLLGLMALGGCLVYLADVPRVLHIASPETGAGIRQSIVRVTFMSLVFSVLFSGIGVSAIQHLRRNPGFKNGQTGLARALIRTLTWSAQRRGIPATLRAIFRYAKSGFAEVDKDPGFDAAFGTDTNGFVMPAAMDVANANVRFGTRYEATTSWDFARALGALPAPPGGFTFVDLGCGKGRALLMASQFGFARVIGVDYSPTLCHIAQQNIRQFSRIARPSTKFDVSCCDAASYAFPDDPSVIYMFNPFREPIMKSVLANVRQSLDSRPRDVFLVYVKPMLHELLDGTDFLVNIARGDTFMIYRARAGAPC